MSARDAKETTAVLTVPRWQELKYPSEDKFIEVADKYPDLDGVTFHELPGWIRLGWPDEALWHRVARTEERERAREQKIREPQPWPISRRPWAEAQAMYPLRSGIPDAEQDFYRMLRFWPDAFGQQMIEIEIGLTAGININSLWYGPGKLRVPESVGVVLRNIDSTARQHFIDQFIPKVHQDKVIATLSMKGTGAAGEVSA